MNEENNNSSNQGATTNNSQTGVTATVNHVLENKISALLWLMRVGTLVFTIHSLLSDFRIKTSSYQRALLCNAAASALRLHQRLPRVQLSIEFGAVLLLEDSCHYLLYSLLFIYSVYPVHMALLPIFFYALLHSSTYSLALLTKLDLQEYSIFHMLTSIATNRQRPIFRFIAFSEICIMPFLIFMIFCGKGSFISAFAYYRFLTLRYASRRNPYTRFVFGELRVKFESYANSNDRSQYVHNFCHKIIHYLNWLAPAVPSHQ